MKTDLNKKYKDRNPNDTVELLKNFFSSKGYTFTEQSFETEAGTWTAHLELFKNGLYILQSNGKGMTKEFCLASGYAEMYERYCNMHPLICNATFAKRIMENNFKENNYYFNSNERFINFGDIKTDCPEIANYLLKSLKTEDNVKRYLNTQFGQLVGIPFYSVKDSDIIYMDPRVASISWTSMGLSAGNTITEALTQAMSELCERIGTANFFLGKCDKYYILNLDNIENTTIKNTIKKIQNLGYKFYVFDLSYNFNVPTLMSLLIDPLGLLTRVNFGAFPVFDIAIERIITEIYQGIFTYKRENVDVQTPFKEIGATNFLNSALNNISGGHCVIEDFLDKAIFVDSYNENIFINGVTSNDEILDYLNKIFDNLNLKCYVADMSLIPEIRAIRVLCPKLNLMEEKINRFEKMSPLLVNDALEVIEEQHELINKTLNLSFDSSKEKIKEVYDCFQKLFKDSCDRPSVFNDLVGNLTFQDPTMVFNSASSPIVGTLINWGKMYINFVDYQLSYWMEPLKKYATLLRYVQCKKYTNEEIKKVMALLGNIVTDEEIDNIQDVDYITMKIYIQTTLALYNSPFYQDLVSQFLR